MPLSLGRRCFPVSLSASRTLVGESVSQSFDRCSWQAVVQRHFGSRRRFVTPTSGTLQRRRLCAIRDGAGSRPRRASRPAQDHTADVIAPRQLSLQTIGLVRSPYKERFGCPRQPPVEAGVFGGCAQQGMIELLESTDGDRQKLTAALQDLEGFEFIWIISYLHLNEGWSSRVTPPRGPRQRRGVLATRAPHRPNHIGLSACRLHSVDTANLTLTVHGLDLLDGTPVLDLKPYVPYCDSFPEARAGWLDEIGASSEQPDRLSYWPPPPHLRK